jgi:glycosyltransferase involved in cell wall biosynthesis
MKVVYLTSWRETSDGGSSKAAFGIARAAVTAGVDTAIIHPGDRTEKYVENGLIHFSVLSYTDQDASFPKLTPSTVKSIFEFLAEFDPDILHTQHEGFLGMVGMFWSIQHNKRFIATSHMLPTQVNAWMPVSKSSSYLLDLIHKTGFTKALFTDFYRNCNVLIGLNDAAVADIKKFGYKGEIWQIPNGRNLRDFLSLKIPKVEDETINLIFIGQIHRRKNQLFLVEMLGYLPKNYRLKLVGSFMDKSLLHEINTLKDTHNLGNRVELTGPVSYHLVPSLLEEAHIFVSASTLEVQALAVIEALAAGKPIVGIANETIDEFIDDQVGKKLPKNVTPQDFAQAVLDVVADKSEYYRKAELARKKIASLDWPIVMQTIIAKYEELLKKPITKSKRSALLRTVARIPNKKLKAYLLTRMEKEEQIPKKKTMRLPTRLIVGISLIASVVVYTAWKIVNGLRPKKKSQSQAQ